jgi:membrane fusion protein, multidrug efflux system
MPPRISPPARHSRAAALSSIAVVLLVAGCKPKEEAQPPQAGPPPEVMAVTVAPRDIPVTFEYTGQTAGVREVEVRPRVGGILLKWNYTEGARVAAGQSLFTVDPVPYQANANRLEAAFASMEARHAQAVRETARIKPLVEQGMVTRKAYDDAVSNEQIAAADARTARAAVTQARIDLGYTNVPAPIAGVTGRALKSEGSLVEAQNTLLTTISQIDPIHVIFVIPEAEHLRIQREAGEGKLKMPADGNFEARVMLADGTQFPHAGKVDFTNVRVDPATGGIEARAVIPNPDLRLRPGQFARVLVGGAIRPQAVSVPQRAILEGPGTKIVLTVNAKGLVEPRPVQVGDWAGQEWIVTGGLAPGDRVIVDGIIKARPGSPVKIAAPAPAGGAPAAPPAAPPAGKP